MAEIFDVVVIGSGPGGYVAAIRASQLGLKTACVDQNAKLGGTCLNVGCIPSKVLLKSSALYSSLLHELPKHGIYAGKSSFDFSKMMERKSKVIQTFNAGIQGLFRKNKITFIEGKASFQDSQTIQVGKETVQGKHFIIATGSVPITLPFLPVDEKRIVTNTGALSLEQVPKKLVVIGAGVIGIELGSIYNRLGTQVELCEFAEQICPTLDASVSKRLRLSLEKQGLIFHTGTKVVSAEIESTQIVVGIEKNGNASSLSADIVLCCIGRKANVNGLGLEKISVESDPKKGILVNEHFQTKHSHIFAIGDVIDGPMLAHKASEEGVVVAERIAGLKTDVDYLSIPSAVYTEPEVGSVGITEEQARRMQLSIKVGEFPFKANSRAQCSGHDEGFVKVIALQGNNRVVGVHILGANASELVSQATQVVYSKLTLADLAHAPCAHPTLAEALKEAALSADKQAIHI